MSDFQAYIENRKATDEAFIEGYAEGFLNFKTGVLLKQLREQTDLEMSK